MLRDHNLKIAREAKASFERALEAGDREGAAIALAIVTLHNPSLGSALSRCHNIEPATLR